MMYERIDWYNPIDGFAQIETARVKAEYYPVYYSNVAIRWDYSFADGQSSWAVARRIRREARKLRLAVRGDGDSVMLAVVTRRDLTRLAELLKFCNGRSLAATAANNRGRW